MGYAKKLITVTIPNEPNALKADELKKIGKKYFPTSTANNTHAALRQLSTKENKTIVIFGSLYLVGEVLSKN